MKRLFNKSFLYMLLGVMAIICIPILLNLAVFHTDPITDPDTEDPDNEEESSDSDSEDESDENGDSDSEEDEKKIYWGVDSANRATKNSQQCVSDHYGNPEIWGRYLGDKEDVSTGLDQDEVKSLHKHDIDILLIYNHFTDATGYDHGEEEAKQAIKLTNDLDVPDDVAIFGDIEPKFPVDSPFLEGWYDALADSDYKPGLYGVFDEDSNLITAFNDTKKKAQKKTIVWTAYPDKEITKKNNAPKFKGEGPDKAPIDGWQYGIDAETCDIDTNLFKKEILDHVW